MEMSKDDLVKVLVLGPVKSGKSTITNFLCSERDTPSAKYYETNPLRIAETELELEATKLGDRRVVFSGGDAKVKRVRVQVWDLSGNSKHQACWPAVADGADAIIFVCNPEVCNSEKELSLWYKNFAINPNEIDEDGHQVHRVKDAHCLMFAHHSTPPEKVGAAAIPPMPKGLEKVEAVETSLDYHSANFKESFDKLVERVVVSRMMAEEDEMLRRERVNDSPQMY